MIYFAYGPDLNPGQMGQRAPGYRSLGVARLADHWICFPRFSPVEGAATISIMASPGDAVWGALYEIPAEDVPIVNHIYGFNPEGLSHLNEHVMQEVTVQRLGHSQPVAAATYVAVPEERESPPSQSYMTLVIDGARYHGLPRAYVAALEAVGTVPR